MKKELLSSDLAELPKNLGNDREVALRVLAIDLNIEESLLEPFSRTDHNVMFWMLTDGHAESIEQFIKDPEAFRNEHQKLFSIAEEHLRWSDVWRTGNWFWASTRDLDRTTNSLQAELGKFTQPRANNRP